MDVGVVVVVWRGYNNSTIMKWHVPVKRRKEKIEIILKQLWKLWLLYRRDEEPVGQASQKGQREGYVCVWFSQVT